MSGLELGTAGTEPPEQIRAEEESLQERNGTDGFESMQKITDRSMRNTEAFRKKTLVICAWNTRKIRK